MTQDELADKAEIDRSAYNRIENDKIGLGPIRAGRLANALGVSPVELGGGESEDPGEYRSLHERLEELEAALQQERRLRERGVRAVTRRLAELEAALDSLTREEGHGHSAR